MSEHPFRDGSGWLYIDPAAGASVESLAAAARDLLEARTVTGHAQAVIDLSNALSDVRSWLPPNEEDES